MEPDAPSNLKRRPMVAVIGDASTDPAGAKAAAARQVGALIIERRWRLVTGGMGGVMQEASAGARASVAWVDGDIIGIAPGSDPAAANPFVDVVIATGMDHLRNSIVAHSDAIIVIGGGAGTLSEIALAWMYRRLIVALPHEGWGAKVAGMRIDHRVRYEDIPDDRVYATSSSVEAIELIAKLLPQYQRRYSGIKSRKLN